jgi:hypothetical protein
MCKHEGPDVSEKLSPPSSEMKGMPSKKPTEESGKLISYYVATTQKPAIPTDSTMQAPNPKDETDVAIKSWEDNLEFEICFQTSRRKKLN